MRVPSRLPDVGTTIFTEMTALAQQHGAVNLGQGFPDFEGPASLREALTRAMAEGRNQYAPMPGILPLREAVAALAAERDGLATHPDEVTITSGGTEAIYAAIAALVGPGDEAILLDPSYDSYDPAVRLQGGVPVHVPLKESDFSVDWDLLGAAFTARTRLVIVNTPHNPTGATFKAEDWSRLADLIRDRAVWVLSDEVYEHIVFDGQPHLGARSHPEVAQRAVVVGSFGKTFHCTGWKVGYAIAPADLTREFRKVHQFLTFATFHPAQWALAEVLTGDPAHVKDLSAFYQARRDHFRRLLDGSGLVPLPVAGAYFQVVDYSAVSERSDVAFCRWLVEARGVAAIPLSPFSVSPLNRRLVRFCFAKGDGLLEEGAARLRGLQPN